MKKKYMELFRDLEDSEVDEFKKWAHENYTPFTEIKGIWHPVVQQECIEINKNSEISTYDNHMRLEIMKRRTGQHETTSDN